MHGIPAASARSRTISPLSLIDGPTIATTPSRDELVEPGDHGLGRARGQPVGLVADQGDGVAEALLGPLRGEPELQALLEVAPAVTLREVVQHSDRHAHAREPTPTPSLAPRGRPGTRCSRSKGVTGCRWTR